MKIGLFGGSFNPIHNGHIALAKAFLQEGGLDEIWFMVSPQNPFKDSSELLDDNIRLRLVQTAIKDIPRIKASDYEFSLSKPSYTWNTLVHISQDYPLDEFILLIGGDNWRNFNKWKHSEDILSNYKIIVYPRDKELDCYRTIDGKITILSTQIFNISSSDIRQKIKNNEDITTLVPQSIVDEVRKLYQ